MIGQDNLFRRSGRGTARAAARTGVLRPRLAALLVSCALAAALALCMAATETKVLAPEPNYARIARSFAYYMPREHLKHLSIDDDAAAKALDRFLSMIDYDHSFFLASDVASFRQEQAGLDDSLAEGDVGFAYKAFEAFKSRVRNRFDFASKQLDQGFDVNVDETYVWKRKDAPWPVDEKEWDELWRKKIKNEYVSRLLEVESAEKNAAVTNKPAIVAPKDFIKNRYKQLLTVLDDYDAEYVFQTYMTAWAQAFDPHSEYMSQSALEDFDIDMKLTLCGVGALLRSEDGMAKIMRLIPGGPAERDGRLKPEDKIAAVGEGDEEPVSVVHWPLYKTVRRIRGPKETKVVLVVVRGSGGETLRIDLKRDEIKLEEEAASSALREVTARNGKVLKVGVITLPAFYGDISARVGGRKDYRSCSGDVRKILGDLQTNEISGVILDLRNNGGGALTEAVETAGLFIPRGPVVKVHGARGEVLVDRDPAVVYEGPLVVLVNRLSASASEIVAAALQNYGRAVIVGDSKTHGKGTVQSLLALDKGSRQLGSIKVTTACFYRIDGTSTQLAGVRPDIVVPSAFDVMEIGEEFLPNALLWDRESGVRYQKAGDMEGIIGVLRQRSEKRRSSDSRFAARSELLGRIRALHEAREISLNIDARRELAKAEKHLTELQRQNGASENADDGKEPDLVVSEALNILADLATLSARQVAKP